MTKIEKATFAAGCFWGVESAFCQIEGVISTTVGYSGGHTKNPTYEDVCTDKTGHAEAVFIEFDPQIVSYEKLLEIFWSIHDPTTLNRQGLDIGSQYRSIVFYHDEGQKIKATELKDKFEKSGKFSQKIVTEIIPATTFYRAEEYHQKYLQKRGIVRCKSK
ncbi:MAG: methionine sulfoxide reductase A [Candidatus Methanofastidiosum methylothiophilum]|uniref:Peptide methionine sulfoxide reductase MsrA n=1 Tax=Candidatus Methanofastidiosum methylothiophilum TaxID=1705564 RepID=A0A150J804_9EURY|nr:MAG: methionine sulfoxide reductase A [Candidatus Methanofastidiosum methylthiophilus]